MTRPPFLFVARSGKAAPAEAAQAASQAADAVEVDEDDESAAWSLETRTAEELGADMAAQWGPPIDALSKAGKAFEGLEGLLGGAAGGSFDLKVCSELGSNHCIDGWGW